jgi:hypothetical protein
VTLSVLTLKLIYQMAIPDLEKSDGFVPINLVSKCSDLKEGLTQNFQIYSAYKKVSSGKA